MDWANGYPTDINYKIGFYRNLAPLHLGMICALQGVKPPIGPLTYVELGCGAGLSTILLAASNPKDTFIGVDFAPSHIVEAIELAREADIRNVRFIEASFDDDDLIDALPSCDIISLHGVYTWVASRQRDAIRRILSSRLKPGGLFYLAYNNMVASSHEIVLQRALRELSRNGNPDGLKAAFEKIKQMKTLGAEFFRHSSALLQLMEEIGNKDPSYLVHEYLTDHWTPYFFQDLARELESCKLSFLGSAAPADNRDEFLASPEMIGLIRSEDDLNVKQFLTDISSNRRFRNDIFAKGSKRLEPDERATTLRTMVFALAKPISDVELKVTIGRGVLELRRPMFRIILNHLSDAPKTLEGLNLDDNAMVEAITLLSQAAIIHPATLDKIDASAGQRLNSVMFATEYRRSQYGFVAAPRIGSAIPIAAADRIAFTAAQQGWGAGLDAPYLPSQEQPASIQNQNNISFWRALQIVD